MPPIRNHALKTPHAEIDVLATTVVGRDTVAAIREKIVSRPPDVVVVDYDESRWRWLADPAFREQADLVDIIRKKELPVLNARLAMGILRKVISPPTEEVSEDEEVRVAVETARELGIDVVFSRRAVEVEGVRAWRRSSLAARVRLLLALVFGSLRRTSLAVAGAHEVREQFDARARRAEVERRAGAAAAAVVFNEAELWSASVLGALQGRVLFVTREIQFPGIEAALELDDVSTAGLGHVPEPSLFARVLPWLFSAGIIAAFVFGFAFGDFEKMKTALTMWIVAHVALAGLGAAASGGHPWTIAAAGLSAPFVSLNPAVGAGMIGAFVQAIAAPPSVRDMDKVGDDIAHWRGWWRNRLSRILLVFVLANLGSTAASFLALAWLS